MQHQEEKILKDLGLYIKRKREEKGISLNSFAFQNGLTSATLSRVENGIVDTKFLTLLRILTALEIPANKMLKDLHIKYDLTEE